MSIKPFLVYKSSAGSGKTYTLSKNYIRLALKSTFYFKRILAVTFTNKAAEEMKSRILEMIDDIKKGKEKQLIIEFSQYYNVNHEEIIERATKLQTSIIHNYSYFSISTIDTFFYGIIQSFTRDLKFRGVFNIEMDHELVINEVVERFLSNLEKLLNNVSYVVSIMSKSSLAAPQSGQAQFSGTSSHLVPGFIPSSGQPMLSSYIRPQIKQRYFFITFIACSFS